MASKADKRRLAHTPRNQKSIPRTHKKVEASTKLSSGLSVHMMTLTPLHTSGQPPHNNDTLKNQNSKTRDQSHITERLRTVATALALEPESSLFVQIPLIKWSKQQIFTSNTITK